MFLSAESLRSAARGWVWHDVVTEGLLGEAVVAGVFINYRSEDSDTAAALIDRELSERFGSDQVFLASRSIPPGTDFHEELLRRLRSCSVLLVVIGQRWLTLTDTTGQRRIDHPTDWVRREIAEALRLKLRVIPVLIGEATLPAEADLPADIAGLSRRQYMQLRRRYPQVDLNHLVERITKAEPELAKSATRRQSSAGPFRRRFQRKPRDIESAQGRHRFPTQVAAATRVRRPLLANKYRPATRKRLAVAAIAAILALVAASLVISQRLSRGPQQPDNAVPEWRSKLAPCTDEPRTDLNILASSDTYHILQGVAKGYGERTTDGRCFKITVSEANRGTTTEDLANCWPNTELPRPDVWIPASTVRLEVARAQAANTKCRDAFPSQPPSVVKTPTIIAMPEEMAKQLGWPEEAIGWSDLAELAIASDGWASKGRDWGPFRLGKTNPNTSSSGLNATVGMFYASRPDSARDDPLTAADVNDEAAKEFVRKIESSIVHYGQDTLRFLANLRRADDEGRAMSYISAVVIDEKSMLAYNEGYPTGAWSDEEGSKKEKPKTKLAAIYPKEGTITHDHPYVQFDWPSTDSAEASAKQRVTDDFLGYLYTPAVQRRFQEAGFRDHEGQVGQLARLENGVDPQRTPDLLELPEASVLDLVLSTWNEVRKPARVLLAVDTSTSMDEGITRENKSQHCPRALKHPDGSRCLSKLELLKNQRDYILSGFTEHDQLGLWEFSAHPNRLVDIGPMNEAGKERLRTEFDNLSTAPYTALYETIAAAVAEVAIGSDENTINAVVVLTDGRNESLVSASLGPLLEQLRQQPVRVFTIAYGQEADVKVLEDIAGASGGAHYDAMNPDDIGDLLVAAIISNF
jgi:Ca-activated chloride channel family protein